MGLYLWCWSILYDWFKEIRKKCLFKHLRTKKIDFIIDEEQKKKVEWVKLCNNNNCLIKMTTSKIEEGWYDKPKNEL